ncbi:solute carrier family 15 member 1 [Bufo gargarizans]|uniref:solute carrier family 15 member 1 n=1 Tax=Bufo gargarizans TaxID=30331 RepID=UPI001CF1E977|nr:solute carrier family 15 member 1 [Bufo gargarizans]XP_044142470.1 solute carrier family 15 member 1 [Bufo gargarizans]XP_044142471.1 solute carrier family 15 member 1 [Bufo gargarizans]
MGRGEKSPGCFGYPLSIFFIVINEFCERFSYYGMRAVLVLYFKYFLQWDDNLATVVYHTFVAVCYLTPILGAIIADSWLGKFKTIVYLSIVYAVGQVIMSVSAIHDISDGNRDGIPDNIPLHVGLSMIGLILIALGTGGIKPCVAAFGGDQFDESQEKQRGRFFSIFYLSINAGSLLSTIITPILRGQECGIHSQQKCYPLAFGVPAALMAVALVVFIIGSGMYKKVSPQGNIIVKVSKCISFAISNRYRNRSKSIPKREHWMDWAKEKYDDLLIAQIKMVLKVLFLYIPLPMFWALFDQQGSRWTLQATTMNGKFGTIQIQPDQMQTVNPILIIVLVPVVDLAIYPLIKKCKLNFTPLKRITVGMFFAAMAFVVAAVIQIEIDKTLPTFPDSSHIQVRAINLDADNLILSFKDGQLPSSSLTSLQASEYKILPLNSAVNFTYGNISQDFSQNGLSGKTRYTWIVRNGNTVEAKMDEDISKKPEQGYNAIKFINNLQETITVKVDGSDVGDILPFSFSNYTMLTSGVKNIEGFTASGRNCSVDSRDFGFGGAFKIIINECASSMSTEYIEDIQANTVHMGLQIPQYFLLTAGEVVFSVTGLEFSYSQAPSNMKSVLQAGWLLTVAVGNIIVLIVAGAAGLSEQWAEYILFAALLVAVCIIFAIMAYFYTYVDPAEIEAQFDSDGKKKKEKEIESMGLEILDRPEKQVKM